MITAEMLKKYDVTIADLAKYGHNMEVRFESGLEDLGGGVFLGQFQGSEPGEDCDLYYHPREQLLIAYNAESCYGNGGQFQMMRSADAANMWPHNDGSPVGEAYRRYLKMLPPRPVHHPQRGMIYRWANGADGGRGTFQVGVIVHSPRRTKDDREFGTPGHGMLDGVYDPSAVYSFNQRDDESFNYNQLWAMSHMYLRQFLFYQADGQIVADVTPTPLPQDVIAALQS